MGNSNLIVDIFSIQRVRALDCIATLKGVKRGTAGKTATFIDSRKTPRYTNTVLETSSIGFRSLLENAALAATALKHCGFCVHTYLLGWGGREGASPAGYAPRSASLRTRPSCPPLFEAMAWLNHKGTTV